MDKPKITNSFSALSLLDADAAADGDQAPPSSSGKSVKTGGGSGEKVEEGIEIRNDKSPLVWIDLEMTGLNAEVDRILEIACVITDGKLNHSVEGPNLVIRQTQKCLDQMDKWNQEHHGASGLKAAVLKSEVTEQEAERQKYMPNLAAMFSHVLVDVSSVRALCLNWYPTASKKAPKKYNKHRAMNDIKGSIAELKFFKENIFKPSARKK
ncbi:Oligoribonuclease-like protein [Drosera capensis]